MPLVRVREDESLENALRRFKRKCEKSGVLSELKKRQHYLKPSQKGRSRHWPQEEGAEETGPGKTLQRLTGGGHADGGRDKTDVVEAVGPRPTCARSFGLPPLEEEHRLEVPGALPVPPRRRPRLLCGCGQAVVLLLRLHTGGDVFKFLMLYEKLEFPEALKMLAARYGIPMPERGARKTASATGSCGQPRALSTPRQRSGRGAEGRRYLAGRGSRRDDREVS